jgi:hypothetical protein
MWVNLLITIGVITSVITAHDAGYATPITPSDFSSSAITIGFDTYPTGISIPGIVVPPFSGNVTNPASIINYGYASYGVIFSSHGNGVVAVGLDMTGQLTGISTPNVIVGMTTPVTYSASAPVYIEFVDPLTGLPSFSTTVGIYARDVDVLPVAFTAYNIYGKKLGATYFPVCGNAEISFAGLTFGYTLDTQIARVEINTNNMDTIALDNLIFEPVGTIIPEPATLILVGTGLIGITRIRKRYYTK